MRSIAKRVALTASAWAALSSGPLASKTLVVSYPSLLDQEGLLQPSVLLGKPGITFESLVSAGRFPSRLSFAATFPMFDQTQLRGSGWMWAIRGGVTNSMFEEGRVFSPSHYFVEAGLGRGTAVPFFEAKTGLRGYMEASYRSERPRYTSEIREISEALSKTIRDQKNFLGIKIGAGSTLEGEGLVHQKPGSWAHRVQAQIYLPLSDASSSVVNTMVQGFRRCPTNAWTCGWHLSYQRHYQSKSGESFEDLSKVVGLGFFVNHHQAESYSISSRVSWPYVFTESHKGFEKSPIVHLNFTKAF